MSAENAWRIAMEAASERCWTIDDCFRSLPMPPAFRAAVEAEAEEAIRAEKEENRWAYVRAALEDNQTEADELRAALVQIAALVPAHIAGEIARKALSRLEAKGESHE